MAGRSFISRLADVAFAAAGNTQAIESRRQGRLERIRQKKLDDQRRIDNERQARKDQMEQEQWDMRRAEFQSQQAEAETLRGDVDRLAAAGLFTRKDAELLKRLPKERLAGAMEKLYQDTTQEARKMAERKSALSDAMALDDYRTRNDMKIRAMSQSASVDPDTLSPDAMKALRGFDKNDPMASVEELIRQGNIKAVREIMPAVQELGKGIRQDDSQAAMEQRTLKASEAAMARLQASGEQRLNLQKSRAEAAATKQRLDQLFQGSLLDRKIKAKEIADELERQFEVNQDLFEFQSGMQRDEFKSALASLRQGDIDGRKLSLVREVMDSKEKIANSRLAAVNSRESRIADQKAKEALQKQKDSLSREISGLEVQIARAKDKPEEASALRRRKLGLQQTLGAMLDAEDAAYEQEVAENDPDERRIRYLMGQGKTREQATIIVEKFKRRDVSR